MIQDIKPHKLYNQYEPEKRPDDGSRVFAFRNSPENKRDIQLLVKIRDEGKILDIPKKSDFAGDLCDDELIYLFSVDDESFFLLDKKEISGAEEVEEGGDYSFVSFMELRNSGLEPKEYVYAAFTAYQLAEWYSVTRYCGRCGAENENDKAERARVCPKCGNRIYPRINPAVIIGITDKETDSIVLTKYRRGYGHNALVAGFTEIGETLEETVAREVMEEVGLKVENIRYYKSQPWGIASDILVGFYCDVVGDKSIRMDEGELKYAEWVGREDIILQPLEYSLTNEMMMTFKNNGYPGTHPTPAH